jgi:prefoldin subunit 5
MALQRELQEKDLDIRHLRKEIEELKSENKLLKTQASRSHSHQVNIDEINARETEVSVDRSCFICLDMQ